MFTFSEMTVLYKFLKELKEKAFNSYFEVEEGKIFVEFEVDEFQCLEKFIKDWLLFHSDIITAYNVEWTDDDVCRFNLFLRKC